MDAIPSRIRALAVSGKLLTTIRFPASSNNPTSRTVNPPTVPSSTILTSTMFGDTALTFFSAISPRHTSFLISVMSGVGM